MPDERSLYDYASSIAEGVGGLLSPNEAEAGSLSKVIRLGTVAAKGVEKAIAKGETSSTAKKLIGTEFMGGIIKDVQKAADNANYRYIILENDTAHRVSKHYLLDQIKEVGSYKHVTEKFGKVAGKTKLDQALFSMNRHIAQYSSGAKNPYWTEKMVKNRHAGFLEQAEQTGTKTVPYALYRKGGLTFPMPKAYGDYLEKAGHLTKVKE